MLQGHRQLVISNEGRWKKQAVANWMLSFFADGILGMATPLRRYQYRGVSEGAP